MIYNPKRKGELTEQIVLCELMKLNVAVSCPIGDSEPYDLIIDIGKLYRIQCRTGRVNKSTKCGTLEFNALSCRNNMSKTYIKDQRDKFDYFAAYFPSINEVIMIEAKEVITNLAKFSVERRSKIKCIEDYKLETVIQRLLY